MSGYVYCTYVRTYAFLVVYSLHFTHPTACAKGSIFDVHHKVLLYPVALLPREEQLSGALGAPLLIPHHPVFAINLCGAKDYAHKLQIRLWWRTVFGTTWWYCDTPNSYS